MKITVNKKGMATEITEDTEINTRKDFTCVFVQERFEVSGAFLCELCVLCG
jgi:hypothetical protein